MRVSKLIARLTALRAEHGDVEVVVAGAETEPGDLPPPMLSVHTAE